MRRDVHGVRLTAVLLLILTLIFAFSGCTAFALRPAETGETDATAPETTGSGEKQPSELVSLLLANETIPDFNQTVVENIHYYYSHYFIGDLGTDAELAAAIAEFYAEYRDLIDESDPGEVTDLLCESYLAAAGDKYAYYMNPEAYAEYTSDMTGNYVGIGVQVTNDAVARIITVTAVFPDTPAYEAGVLAGDVIEAVGDTPASTISFAELVNRIRGEENTEVTVTFARGGETYTRTMTRRTVVQVTASASVLPGSPKIGLIQITEFDETTAPQFKAALEGLFDEGIDGLIFDLRNNPGGLLSSILTVLDYLVPNGTPLANYEYYDGSVEYDVANAKTFNPVIAKDSQGNVLRDKDEKIVYLDVDQTFPANLPIAVLCNEHTASAGELFTCAMQDYAREGLLDVKIVGTVTYGKGTMQRQVRLGSGCATTISFAYYNPPYSPNYEGTGITPDIPVELSEEARNKSVWALTDEEDVQMSAAIDSVTERVVSE